MKSHPGGEEQTRRLIELAALPAGAAVLDMGAGAGETVELLRSLGFAARGIDLAPRSPAVEQGDLLRAPFPDGSFDAVISQCAFFVSGDQSGALREAYRLLKSGGKLLLSDVFFTPPEPPVRGAGFEILFSEDWTALWKEYYLEALWRGDAPCCDIPKGRSSYRLLIGRKEKQDGYL
ncbi:MAG: class I SAM-dependent methyltransferase [Oscillospiraceae bacterium]|nr:class I SAM-dependent methyltransferase [Oscillospiraceae bacterium]